MALTVERVAPGSLAAKVGLQAGDCLLEYDGRPLPSPAALLALEENTFGKASVLLVLERDGQRLEITTPLGKLDAETALPLPASLLPTYEAGRAAFGVGQFAKAARHWNTAAQQVQENSVAAWLYSKVGEAWGKLSDWPQALTAYTAAWERLQESEDTAAQIQAIFHQGRCHTNWSAWDKATSSYELARKLNGGAGREMWEAHSLNNLGRIALYRGDLAQAQDFFARTLQIRERLAPDALHVAASLNNLGNVAYERGDLVQAQDFHTRALHIKERLAPNSLDVAASFNNLGIVAYDRGDLTQAQDFYIRALEIRERLAPNSLDVAASFNNLGVAARGCGNLAQAQDFYTRALEIRERLAPNSLDVAASLNNLGNVAYSQGDLAQAQDFHTRALHIKERLAPNSLDVAASLNNLGGVARGCGNLAQAQDFYTRALEIRERLAPNSLDVATSLNSLGVAARGCGNLAQAQDFHTRALHIKERLAPNSLDVATSLNNLGDVAYDYGDMAQAQNFFTRALRIHERLAPNSLNMADIHSGLGLTYLHQQPVQALPLLDESVRIVEQQRSQITSPEARALLLAQHHEKYAALVHCSLLLNNVEQAFNTLERFRARSLLELLAERRLDFAADAAPELLQQQQTLNAERTRAYSQLAGLVFTPENEAQIQTLHRELHALERLQQELTTVLRQTSPRYAALHYPQPLDLKEAQKALDAGTLLLSFLVDKKQTFLFAVTSSHIEAFILPQSRETLQEQVRAFRRAVDVRRLEYDAEQATLQGHKLYEQLLGLAQVHIKRARRLLLCPDGPLHSLPFAALVTKPGRHPRYLGTEKTLHTTVSATVYAQTLPSSQSQMETKSAIRARPLSQPSALASTVRASARRLLALGDPLYGSATPAFACSIPSSEVVTETPQTKDEGLRLESICQASMPDTELTQMQTRGLSLSSLPHTRAEVENLVQLFGEAARVKVGANATKTAALEESGEADILHLACHGWLDPHVPLSSCLIFSLPEALGKQALEGDNGMLQAWEIMQKVKLKADLVVLSACQTGLGQEVRGEGLIGLTRAFQYAGARSLVVTLWEIGDASTAVFMQAFYTAWLSGQSKDEALQLGMKVLQTHPQWNHPFYWSAFVLIGNPN